MTGHASTSRVHPAAIIEARVRARTASRSEYAALRRYERRQKAGFPVHPFTLTVEVATADIVRSLRPLARWMGARDA